MTRRFPALLLFVLTAFAHPAAAQPRPAAAVEFSVGALMFPDDGILTSEGLIGGTGRFYVSPRISVGPEIGYTNGKERNHVMVTGNVTFDLSDPGRDVTPYLVAGAGLFRTTETFGTRRSTHNEGAFTAGGGIRALFGDHLIAGAELRVGWETHVRANGFVGLRFGR